MSSSRNEGDSILFSRVIMATASRTFSTPFARLNHLTFGTEYQRMHFSTPLLPTFAFGSTSTQLHQASLSGCLGHLLKMHNSVLFQSPFLPYKEKHSRRNHQRCCQACYYDRRLCEYPTNKKHFCSAMCPPDTGRLCQRFAAVFTPTFWCCLGANPSNARSSSFRIIDGLGASG